MKKHPVIKSSSLLAIACTECIQSELLRGLLSGISRPTVEVHRTLHYLMCNIWNVYGLFACKITTFLQNTAISPKKNEKKQRKHKTINP